MIVGGLRCQRCFVERPQSDYDRYSYAVSKNPLCNICKADDKKVVPKKIVYERNCLRCSKPFKSKNKYIRQCQPCKTSVEFDNSNWFGSTETV